MTFNQVFLAQMIEYHWWRIRVLRKRKKTASGKRMQKLNASENLHRYKAEAATVKFEVSLGLRNEHGIWM